MRISRADGTKVKRSLSPGVTGRIVARLAVGIMALALAGLGWVVVWSAVSMQNEATGLADVGAQTGGQVRALQAISTIQIEIHAMEDEPEVLKPERVTAVRKAREALHVALDEMEHGNVAAATAVARRAKPMATELDAAIDRYLSDPRGDVLNRDENVEGDDAARDALNDLRDKLELMLNGREVNPSNALSGMLGNVTEAEHNIRAIALVLVPLGLLSAAASAWLLTVLRRRADEHNRAERRRLETVLVGLPSPVIVTDEAEAVVLANPAATELTGWTEQSIRALAELDVRDGAGAPVDLPRLAATTRETGRRLEPLEARLTRPDGTASQITLEAVPLAEQAGRIPGVVVALADITAQRTYEEHLHYQAYHDGLTGLPNRALLWERVNTAVTNGVPYVVMLVDLDGFKAVNDNLGHHIGDELLQGVGSRLSVVVGSSATVARQGGDEFAILLYDAGLEEASAVAAAVRECFTDPFLLSCGPVQGAGSVGFAVAEPGQSPDHVVQLADEQMYVSKSRSRAETSSKTTEAAR